MNSNTKKNINIAKKNNVAKMNNVTTKNMNNAKNTRSRLNASKNAVSSNTTSVKLGINVESSESQREVLNRLQNNLKKIMKKLKNFKVK